MQTKDVFESFTKICFGRKSYPDSLVAWGLDEEPAKRLGSQNRNVFNKARSQVHPFSEKISWLLLELFSACINGKHSQITAADAASRFANWLYDSLDVPSKYARRLIEAKQPSSGTECSAPESPIISCFREILVYLKTCKSDEEVDRRKISSIVRSHLPDKHISAITLNCVDNDLRYYSRAFEKPLSLERSNQHRITLKDVYTDPDYCYYSRDGKIILPNASLKEFIQDFISEESCNTVDVLTILGHPGVGKSSLVSYLAYEYLKDDFCPDITSFYCIALRDLANTDFVESDRPMQFIRNGLGLSQADLNNSVFILDGLDELSLVLAAGPSINAFYEDLIRDASRYRDCKIVITSRVNYINGVFRIPDDTIIVELKEFTWTKAELMIKKIGTARHSPVPNEISLALKRRHTDYSFLTAPLFLYMISTLEIDVGDIDEIGQLYDRVFDELRDRNYDKEGNQALSSVTDVRKIARSFAAQMRRKGRKYLDANEAQKVLEHCDIANLSERKKEAIEQGYGLTFYYKKNVEDVFAPEFLHLTFVEYLAAEEIFYCMFNAVMAFQETNALEKIDDLGLQLDYLLSGSDMSAQTVDFFRYRVLSHLTKDSIKPFQDYLVGWLLGRYLPQGMVFSAWCDIDSNCLHKSSRLFFNYWRLIKGISPNEPILDNTNHQGKRTFIDFLRTAMRSLDSTISLRFENYSHMDMSDLDLADYDLYGTNFSFSDLSYSRLNRADLRYANFKYSNLLMTDFSEATVENTNIAYSERVNTRFDGLNSHRDDNKTEGKASTAELIIDEFMLDDPLLNTINSELIGDEDKADELVHELHIYNLEVMYGKEEMASRAVF